MRPNPSAIASCVLALSCFAAAQSPQPQAFYPLLNGISDATGLYGDVSLLGNPTPPAAPANGSGVCTTGVYRFSGGTGWTEVQTPDIATLDQTDFQVNVEFNVTGINGRDPILMAGNGWRWIGLYHDAAGLIGIKYNNSNYAWSTTTLATGTWYAAELKHENGSVEVYLDGALVLQQAIPALNTNNDFDFMPTDYSNGGAFFGCLRNLLICNDTTLGAPMVAPYGSGCGPTTGGPAPAISAESLPVVGHADFGVSLTDGPATAPAFLVLGFGTANITVGVGCTQLVSIPLDTLAFALTDTNGDLSIPVPVPNDPALSGLAGYFQWVTADANGPVRGTFTLSDALAIEVY